MPKIKPIPVGVEDFKRLVDKGYNFIDKTLMIKDLLDNEDMISLITRPRRFGKTLNLSMIQRFFEKTEESNAYLFENLKISYEGEEYLKHQGKYPVITLSLKALKQPDYDKSIDFFKFIVQAEYKRHKKILENNIVKGESVKVISSLQVN